MSKCPQCQTVNAEGSLLCSRCGQSLSAVNSTANIPTSKPPSYGAPTSHVRQPAQAIFSPNSSPVKEGTPYKSSGQVQATMIPFILGAGILAAVFVGAVYGVVTSLLNILILFPLVGGICTGRLIAMAATEFKNRSVAVAAIVGVVAGFLTMAVSEFTLARTERSTLLNGYVDQVVQIATTTGRNPIDGSNFTQDQLPQVQATARQYAEARLTPWQTFEDYESQAAANGTTLQTHGASLGITLTGNGYWTLQGLDCLLMVFACAGVCVSAAKKPFCESCSQWHKSTDILKVHPIQNPAILTKIQSKDWLGLLNLPVGQTMDKKNSTTVNVTCCETCGSGTLNVTSTSPVNFERQNLGPESTNALLNSLS